MVAGILNENGIVVNKVIPNTTTNVLRQFMVDNVAAGSIMASDSWPEYITAAKGYLHIVVDILKMSM